VLYTSRGKGTSNIRCQDGGVDLGRTYACHCHAKGEISRHLDLVNSRGDSAVQDGKSSRSMLSPPVATAWG
jgi:hypothetical protein